MERILVLTPHEDRAGRAVALAGALARRTGARLTLLRVLEERLGSVERPHRDAQQVSIRELLTDLETRRVGELAERACPDVSEVSVEVVWGVAWEVVVDLVERDRFDLVVKPASGMNRQGRVFFGSTALHLFRRCPCPVWVVGDDGRLPERILAAVDPTFAPKRREAAMRILDWAERIAAWAEGPVEVATAWHAPAAELLVDEIPAAEWKAYVDDARERAQRDLDALLAARSAPWSADRRHLVEGPAHEVLPRFAGEQGFDLLVMGTLGRTGRVGDLLGETAETILRQIRSSVLTIPPAADLHAG